MKIADISNRIKYFRKEVEGLSQAKFGKAVFEGADMTDNAKQQRIKNFEIGRKVPDDEELALILKALGITIDEFKSAVIAPGIEPKIESTGEAGDVMTIDIPKSFVEQHPEIVDSLRLLGEAEKMGKGQALKDAILKDLLETIAQKHAASE